MYQVVTSHDSEIMWLAPHACGAIRHCRSEKSAIRRECRGRVVIVLRVAHAVALAVDPDTLLVNDRLERVVSRRAPGNIPGAVLNGGPA